MYRPDLRLTLLPVVALLTMSWPSAPLAQRASDNPPGAMTRQAPVEGGTVRGTTMDASEGVLPGVTVSASSVDGRQLGVAITDAQGTFVIEGLPAGNVILTFALNGFDTATTTTVVTPSSGAPPLTDTRLVQRLALAGHAELVTVRGDPPPPPPPPLPTITAVPEHDKASVCGPAMAETTVPSFGTVISRRHDETKVLFSSGDQLLIDGGADTGLRVGLNFVVRRQYPTSLRYGRNQVVTGEHSSGLLQVVEVQDEVATAVVVYACDEIMRGDYLAAFDPQPNPIPEPRGTPVFDKAGRVLFADAGQPVGVTGRMMVVDLGERHDVRAGQRLTLFRRSRIGDAQPLVVGEALVVAVRKDTSTIRVEHATDAIFAGERGDWAAPQRAEGIAER